MVTVRVASRADAGEMARIQTASLRRRATEDYSEAQLAHLAPQEPDATTIPDAEFVDDQRHTVVAERDGELVGWGSVYLDVGVIAATFVDPDHAEDGIGTAIVRELEAVARDADLDTITVPATLNAVGFYERLGFERRREIDAGDPDGPALPNVELAKDLE